MARMYINICLNIHGYFSGVLLCWNFQFLFVTFFFSFVSVDHFQIKPAMADLSLISDTTIFIKIHFDLPNINIHFFLLKYISVIFTAIARLVTFLNITINIHGHLMCSFLREGFKKKINYFHGIFHKGGTPPPPPPSWKIINFSTPIFFDWVGGRGGHNGKIFYCFISCFGPFAAFFFHLKKLNYCSWEGGTPPLRGIFHQYSIDLRGRWTLLN